MGRPDQALTANAELPVNTTEYGLLVRQIGKSPTELVDANNNSLAVLDSVNIPAMQSGILVFGSDYGAPAQAHAITVINTIPTGTEYGIVVRPIGGSSMSTVNQGTQGSEASPWWVQLTDGANSPIIGNTTPVGNEYGLYVRLVDSGAINIGTVNQGTANSAANSWPVEITDGTNILGTSAHPVRTDPTGSTTQPVSGTITANQGGLWSTGRTWTLTSGSDSVTTVPSGTQTITGTVSATQGTSPWVDNLTQVGGASISLGQKVMAQSLPITIASDQSALPVSQSGTWNVGLSAGSNLVGQFEITDGTNILGTSTHPIRVDPTGVTTQPISGTIAATQSGSWTVQQGTPPWSVSQSGAWTTGRTWSLNSGTDSVTVVGTITASESFSAAPNTALPSTTAWVGASDGTNLQGLLVESASQKNLRVSLWSGATEATVTAGNALKVDGSAVTQPVSGNLGRTWTLSSGTDTVTTVPSGIQSVSQSGAWTTGRTWSLASGSDSVTIVPSGTQTITGTVTANIGTTGGLALDTSVNGLLLAQASTTSGQSGPLVQGAVTTAAPTYTTAKTSPLSLTTAGSLRVDGSGVTQPVSGTITANQGGAPWSQNLTQVGGSSIALGQALMAASLPVTIASNQSALPVTQSGAWTTGRTWALNSGTDSVTVAGTITATESFTAAPNAALPSNTAWIGASDGTNLQGLLVESSSQKNLRISLWNGATEALVTASNALKVDGSAVTQPVSGSLGRTWTLASGSDSVTIVPSGTQTVSGTVAATQSGTWTVQQGTPPWSVSQSGGWTVTANAGTNLNTSALALDTSVNGILLSQGSTTSGQKGPLIQGAVTTAAPSYSNTQTAPLSLTLAGALRTDSSATTQPISGTITANIGTTGGLALDATLAKLTVAQGASLGSNTQALIGGSVTTAAPGYTTGQISPLSLTTAGALRVDTTGSSSGTVNQGTANTPANGWPIKITDGTNVAAVKAASTAAVAADPSLVVALSPNSPTPAGTNTIGGVFLDDNPSKVTYSASAVGFAPAATATDVFTITGSGSKTIRITYLSVSGSTSAGSGVLDSLVLIKRSTANTGGTSASAFAVPHDSANGAATATVLSYTANPTLGTAVGTVRSNRVAFQAAGAASQTIVWDWGTRPAESIVLRGANQVLAVNLSSTTIIGGALNIDIEFTEE